MCLGTFSRRGAVASATIYLCAECASLRSAFLFHRTQFPMKQKSCRETAFFGPVTQQLFYFCFLTGNLLPLRSVAKHIGITIYKLVHDVSQYHGTGDIDHRVLFQKYSGHADSHHDDK